MAFAELTRLHSMNFWIFPVEVFGIRPKTMAFGVLKPDIRARQNTLISASVAPAHSGGLGLAGGARGQGLAAKQFAAAGTSLSPEVRVYSRPASKKFSLSVISFSTTL
jgi:hypothetical protein